MRATIAVMAFIRTIPPEEATGLLAEEYQAATARAGRVYQILRAQSLDARVLSASVALYRAMMHGPSPLGRAEREMIAVVVSRQNDCFY